MDTDSSKVEKITPAPISLIMPPEIALAGRMAMTAEEAMAMDEEDKKKAHYKNVAFCVPIKANEDDEEPEAKSSSSEISSLASDVVASDKHLISTTVSNDSGGEDDKEEGDKSSDEDDNAEEEEEKDEAPMDQGRVVWDPPKLDTINEGQDEDSYTRTNETKENDYGRIPYYMARRRAGYRPRSQRPRLVLRRSLLPGWEPLPPRPAKTEEGNPAETEEGNPAETHDGNSAETEEGNSAETEEVNPEETEEVNPEEMQKVNPRQETQEVNSRQETQENIPHREGGSTWFDSMYAWNEKKRINYKKRD